MAAIFMLAESDHLRFAVGSDTVVRPPQPSALIPQAPGESL